ncbi:G protein pathway suppressor 2 [Aethina tumida]|uniref:G protein pathway suppressor 2 n=1 Tax=Aethina tumida TaxID=116153 RepID=UPI002147EF25|nr:G protein pathway suppressor 2 [Aethina tumida]XP_049817165.1 G protein pathway suppressor 2 [Aethina tumida]XP_049817166.1 G protein pathway suppressor 2 [Aethina tumida]
MGKSRRRRRKNINGVSVRRRTKKMPAATTENPKPNPDQMWNVLKTHILRERARKKQEREAEVEEERLRKEREAREQQDVMTLGETREQIQQLETKLTQLKEEKHQLFLQLKKVLNEDDNRRRQLVKENDMHLSALQTMPGAFVPQTVYISPAPRGQQVAGQQYKTTVKRPRSPSPQPAVPVSMYHQGYAYKPAQQQQMGYQTSPQKDDTRRTSELSRAVLWNKPSQYASQTSAFYPVPPPPNPQELPVYFPIPTQSQRAYDSRPQTVYVESKHDYHSRAGHQKALGYVRQFQGQQVYQGRVYQGGMGGYLPRE